MKNRKASTIDAKLAALSVGDHFIAGDVPGLVLRKREARAGSWLLRIYHRGRRRVVSLGPWPDMDHRAATDFGHVVRREALAGRDIQKLLTENRTARKLRSFAWCAARLATSMAASWTPRHAQQWVSTVRRFAFPVLGAIDIADIRREHVLQVLQPIWSKHPQTSARLRQRIEAVIDYARALGLRTGDNPAAWRGGLKSLLPNPSRVRMVQHHPAVAHRHAPELFAHLQARIAAGGHAHDAMALAFLMLTATRSGEVCQARWSEIDMERALWIIPAKRMKARKEHRIPLSEPAVMLLLAAQMHKRSEFVFTKALAGQTPIEGAAMVQALRESLAALELPTEATVHGLRSTFRDWAGEETRHSREVIEHALAHKLKDAVEAAYAHGDLLAKRAALMTDWAAHLQSKIDATIAGVMGQQTAGNKKGASDASE